MTANKQFLLLIDVLIQDRSQQIMIYEVFKLNIPHEIFQPTMMLPLSFLGITKDETMAVKLSATQFQVCQAANGQFATYLHLFSH